MNDTSTYGVRCLSCQKRAGVSGKAKGTGGQNDLSWCYFSYVGEVEQRTGCSTQAPYSSNTGGVVVTRLMGVGLLM